MYKQPSKNIRKSNRSWQMAFYHLTIFLGSLLPNAHSSVLILTDSSTHISYTSVQQLKCKAHSCSHSSETLIDHHCTLPFGKSSGKYIKEKWFANSPYKIRKIIIDPGHGGLDSGCLGSSSEEKHIALAIALKLGEHISKIYPDIQIIYTRTTDVFIPLHERAQLANRHKADLFISIHCNYAEYSTTVNGSETYVMGLHTAEYNLEVAKRENASILLEDNYEKNYGGYDPNSPEGHIILSMFQNAYLEQSINFAEKVEHQFAIVTGRKSRGVKQAGFVVLKETAMPSVLVETGFLSNEEDEAFLFSERGQDLVAGSVLRAFTAYKRELETKNQQIATLPGVSTPNLKAPHAEQIPLKNEVTADKVNHSPNPNNASPPTETITKTLPSPLEKNLEGLSTTSPSPSAAELSKNQNGQSTKKPFIQFKVQFYVSPNTLPTDAPQWRTIDCLVEIKKVSGEYHYIATGFHSYEEAVNAKEMLRKSGFSEAFVIAFADGARIDVQQARALNQP